MAGEIQLPEIYLDCDLGAHLVEAYFFIDDVSSYLALQSGIPEATIQAHIIAGAGLTRTPPRSGELVMYLGGYFFGVNELALAAMKRVIFFFVSPEGRDRIVEAYIDEDYGDVHNISRHHFDGNVHWMVITAVLDVMRERDELPIHPSWL